MRRCCWQAFSQRAGPHTRSGSSGAGRPPCLPASVRCRRRTLHCSRTPRMHQHSHACSWQTCCYRRWQRHVWACHRTAQLSTSWWACRCCASTAMHGNLHARQDTPCSSRCCGEIKLMAMLQLLCRPGQQASGTAAAAEMQLIFRSQRLRAALDAGQPCAELRSIVVAHSQTIGSAMRLAGVLVENSGGSCLAMQSSRSLQLTGCRADVLAHAQWGLGVVHPVLPSRCGVQHPAAKTSQGHMLPCATAVVEM